MTAIPKSENTVLLITKISYLEVTTPTSIFKVDKFHCNVYLPEFITFDNIYFTPGSATFEEKQKDEEPGRVYEQELKFMFPGEDDQLMSLVDKIDNGRRLLIKMTFQNGTKKLIGSIENGAVFLRSTKISGKQSVHEISFSCKQQYPSRWISYDGVYIEPD